MSITGWTGTTDPEGHTLSPFSPKIRGYDCCAYDESRTSVYDDFNVLSIAHQLLVRLLDPDGLTASTGGDAKFLIVFGGIIQIPTLVPRRAEIRLVTDMLLFPHSVNCWIC